eukprot:gene14479-14600_t
MSKTKPKHDPRAIPITVIPDPTEARTKARAALAPSNNAASVIEAYQGNIMGKDVDLGEMVDRLRETVKEVNGGDLSRLEAMLVCQATVLQTMFTSLARRASNQQQLKQYETFMALALKAQAQSRATLSALVDFKYPRQATFVKQANIANGTQQVNNGAVPHYATSTHTREKNLRKPNYWSNNMADRWTPERWARQAALIRTWKPWRKSTGPKTPGGKATTSTNGYKGGHRQMLRAWSRLVSAEVKEAREPLTTLPR